MKTWTTENWTVYQVLRGRSNSFLVNYENNYILIDTGRKNSWKELSAKLDEILGENKLSCLILTHTHFDHVEKISQKFVEFLEHRKSTIFESYDFFTSKIIENRRFSGDRKCIAFSISLILHVENAAKIKEKYKSKIIVHGSEAEYLKQGNTPLPKVTNLATGFIVNIFGKRPRKSTIFGAVRNRRFRGPKRFAFEGAKNSKLSKIYDF